MFSFDSYRPPTVQPHVNCRLNKLHQLYRRVRAINLRNLQTRALQGGHHGNLATLHLRHISVYTCAYLKVKGGGWETAGREVEEGNKTGKAAKG
mgnify:CR=1 FL=1